MTLEQHRDLVHWGWYAPEHGETAHGLLELDTEQVADLLRGHCILFDGRVSRCTLMVRMRASSLEGSAREVATHQERPRDVEPTELEAERERAQLIEDRHWHLLRQGLLECAEHTEQRAHEAGMPQLAYRLFRRRALEVELRSDRGRS